MLTRNELSVYKTSTGFNLGQVEEDYIQHIFLMYFYRFLDNEIVFKGGTALQKTLALNRFSEDLDFTMVKTLKITDIIGKTVKEMNVFGCETTWKKLKEDKNSMIFQLKSKGPLYSGTDKSLTYVKVEISKRERIILPASLIEIIPIYKDIPPYFVVTMDTSEIMAEKIKAIYTRDNPKDVYDLYFLIKKRVTTSKEIVNRKLLFYELEFDKQVFIEAVKRKRKVWKGLNQLLSRVPDFDGVMEEINRMEFMKE
jgi:predicted nucleotidyltransferase component of viral defense system